MHVVRTPKRAVNRIVSLLVFTFILGVTANAYTVVMRGGRRIEIPSRFVVTASTLTYEAAPGIQITLQVAAIDIQATEKANSEKPGSLLRRGQLTPLESSDPTPSRGKDEQNSPATHATRTITNRDLEPSVRRRLESESAYENRRKQLGLPSAEESRRQAAAESELISAELEQKRVAEKETEDYWRGRAAALRTEMAALDAQLAYVRARLDEGPFPLSNGWGSFTTVNSVVPFVSFGNFGRRSFANFGAGRSFPGSWSRRPNVFVAPRAGAQVTGRVAFGGPATRGQLLLNPGTVSPGRPMGIAGRSPALPNVAFFGATIPDYNFSGERGALITSFNELAAARAGLRARWRELEEEARRAGAPPGWLRP